MSSLCFHKFSDFLRFCTLCLAKVGSSCAKNKFDAQWPVPLHWHSVPQLPFTPFVTVVSQLHATATCHSYVATLVCRHLSFVDGKVASWMFCESDPDSARCTSITYLPLPKWWFGLFRRRFREILYWVLNAWLIRPSQSSSQIEPLRLPATQLAGWEPQSNWTNTFQTLAKIQSVAYHTHEEVLVTVNLPHQKAEFAYQFDAQ